MYIYICTVLYAHTYGRELHVHNGSHWWSLCGSVSSYITGGWLLLTPLEKWWSSSLGMMTFPKKRWKVIKCHGSKPPTRYISVPQVATSMHLWLDSDQNLKLTGKTPSTTLTQLSVTHVVDGPLCKYLLVIMVRLELAPPWGLSMWPAKLWDEKDSGEEEKMLPSGKRRQSLQAVSIFDLPWAKIWMFQPG